MFDLEGTVLDSNIVEQYLWVRSNGFRKAAWPGEVASLLTGLPAYLRAEGRDRGEFIRSFLRRYSGMPVARLQNVVSSSGYGETVRRHTLPDALARIAEHRAAGHRTVLVTGSIGTLAAPSRTSSTRSWPARCTSATASTPATWPNRRSSTRPGPPGSSSTPVNGVSTSQVRTDTVIPTPTSSGSNFSATRLP
nr:hypothetical protein GCM10025699_42500 [Microbacterium flavescens]